jgi:hypothetical protein
MSQPATQVVVRDILAEVGEIDFEPVLRAAAKVAVKQVGVAKVQEYARRIAAAYISALDLPFDGALARRKALPAVDKFVADALTELNQ